jgi:hypothetical protein
LKKQYWNCASSWTASSRLRPFGELEIPALDVGVETALDVRPEFVVDAHHTESDIGTDGGGDGEVQRRDEGHVALHEIAARKRAEGEITVPTCAVRETVSARPTLAQIVSGTGPMAPEKMMDSNSVCSVTLEKISLLLHHS